jgi:hypothetical protein
MILSWLSSGPLDCHSYFRNQQFLIFLLVRLKISLILAVVHFRFDFSSMFKHCFLWPNKVVKCG